LNVVVVRELIDEAGHPVGGAGEAVEEIDGFLRLEVVRQDLDRKDEAVEAALDVVAKAAEGIVLGGLACHVPNYLSNNSRSPERPKSGTPRFFPRPGGTTGIRRSAVRFDGKTWVETPRNAAEINGRFDFQYGRAR